MNCYTIGITPQLRRGEVNPTQRLADCVDSGFPAGASGYGETRLSSNDRVRFEGEDRPV